MLIEIKYRLIDNPSEFALTIEPEIYYDDGEKIKFDSTPRYIFPYEYIKIDVSLLQEIELKIIDGKNKYLRKIVFWNESKNNSDALLIYHDDEKSITEWLKTEIDRNDCIEFMDFYKDDNCIWEINSHYVIKKEDFSQKFIFHKKFDENKIHGTKYLGTESLPTLRRK